MTEQMSPKSLGNDEPITFTSTQAAVCQGFCTNISAASGQTPARPTSASYLACFLYFFSTVLPEHSIIYHRADTELCFFKNAYFTHHILQAMTLPGTHVF